MYPAAHDIQLRQVAFNHVIRLADLRGGVLDSVDLAVGFDSAAAHSPDQPTARDLQTAADVAPVEHQDCLPEGALGLV